MIAVAIHDRRRLRDMNGKRTAGNQHRNQQEEYPVAIGFDLRCLLEGISLTKAAVYNCEQHGPCIARFFLDHESKWYEDDHDLFS